MFNLARKYEVIPLKISAIKAFDRRLRKYSEINCRDPGQNDEFLEVLRYLAVNSQLEDENDDQEVTSSTLLRCLMRYAVAHLQNLLRDEEYREIVADHSIVGLEFMTVMDQIIDAATL